MSEPAEEDALYEDDVRFIDNLKHHPVIDEFLLTRGWDRAGTGMWRWLPSLENTPENTWDVTTICWDGTRIMVGVVGDSLEYAHLRESLDALTPDIASLEKLRYTG